MGIVDRWEVWGSNTAGGAYVWDCQWPACPAIATHKTKRGVTRCGATIDEPMPWMRVCERHMLAMRELPDQEAFAISHARSRARSHAAPGRFIERTDEDWT